MDKNCTLCGGAGHWAKDCKMMEAFDTALSDPNLPHPYQASYDLELFKAAWQAAHATRSAPAGSREAVGETQGFMEEYLYDLANGNTREKFVTHLRHYISKQQPAPDGEAVGQCPNCLGTTKPSQLDMEWRGRCECKEAMPDGEAVLEAETIEALKFLMQARIEHGRANHSDRITLQLIEKFEATQQHAPDAQLVEDAARYRYIRRKDAWKDYDLHSPGSVGAVFVAGDDGCGHALDESDLDAAVDAALAAAGKE